MSPLSSLSVVGVGWVIAVLLWVIAVLLSGVRPELIGATYELALLLGAGLAGENVQGAVFASGLGFTFVGVNMFGGVYMICILLCH